MSEREREKGTLENGNLEREREGERERERDCKLSYRVSELEDM